MISNIFAISWQRMDSVKLITSVRSTQIDQIDIFYQSLLKYFHHCNIGQRGIDFPCLECNISARKTICCQYWLRRLSWTEYSNLSHEYPNFCFAAVIDDAIWWRNIKYTEENMDCDVYNIYVIIVFTLSLINWHYAYKYLS